MNHKWKPRLWKNADRRCIVCNELYSPIHYAQKSCAKKDCDRELARLRSLKAYRKRALKDKIAKAKKLLERNNYIVTPRIHDMIMVNKI